MPKPQIAKMAMSTKARTVVMAVALAMAAAACGSSAGSATSSSVGTGATGSDSATPSGSSPASSGSGQATVPSTSPLAGKTIDLISSGAAGATHDLFARAIAPALAKYLHATVDVIDKPGGGQLLAWNYTYHAKPNGLTISTVDVEGVLANVWEKVPNNSVAPDKIVMLGGTTGVGGASEVMYAPKSSQWPDIYSLLKEHSATIKELGSVGDVPGPLLFGAYDVPYKDLTSYADSSAELQGLLRGDGNLSVKSWGGSWASYATGGKGKVLLAFTMRPTWAVDPSVPTVGQLLKKNPPPNKQEVKAVIADTTALDAGTGLFAPPGTPSNISSALQAAVEYAIGTAGFKSKADKAQISTTFESATGQETALQGESTTAVVDLMRQYVPLSTGVAS